MNTPCRAKVLGADVGAVKFHVAPINPILISDLLQSLIRQISGISDQTEGPVQPHWTDIIRVPVHHRAGRNTGTAGNALRVQADGLPLPGGWPDLRGLNRRGPRDKVWFYPFQSVDQGFEVYSQISDDRDVVQRSKGDRPRIEIFNQPLTGKSFPAVDHQGARAAHGKTAAIAERKGLVLTLLDLEEGIEYGYFFLISQIYRKLLFVRFGVLFRIETEDSESVNHFLLPRFNLFDRSPGRT